MFHIWWHLDTQILSGCFQIRVWTGSDLREKNRIRLEPEESLKKSEILLIQLGIVVPPICLYTDNVLSLCRTIMDQYDEGIHERNYIKPEHIDAFTLKLGLHSQRDLWNRWCMWELNIKYCVIYHGFFICSQQNEQLYLHLLRHLDHWSYGEVYCSCFCLVPTQV